MNCQEVEISKIDEIRKGMEMRPPYVPGEEGRGVVKFHFKLDKPIKGETVFVISSDRADAPVYKGPFKSSLDLTMDGYLAASKAYDGLEFTLFFVTERKICTWVNERGYQYWRPGSEVSIEFLEEGIFDDDGLFKQHEVTIR